MLKYLNTYRSFLFGLLIFSYVFSVFQKPIFEALHLICHVPAIIFSDGKIHSFSTHNDEKHSHENLTAFHNTSDKNKDLPHSQNNQEIKKKIEISEVKFFTSDVAILLTKKRFQVISFYQSVFIKRPSPPPQFV